MPVGNSAPPGIEPGSPAQKSNLLTTAPLSFLIQKFLCTKTYDDYDMSHDTTKPKNECAPSEDSDQPEHPPSLIRVFAVHLMDSYGLKLSSCGQRRLWSDWADPQADLSLRYAHIHIVGFVMSQLIWALSWEKVSSGVSDQVRLKLACSATEAS